MVGGSMKIPNWQKNSGKQKKARGVGKGVLKARKQALQALKNKLTSASR